MTRQSVELGGWQFTGWESLLGLEGRVGDATVAIGAALMAFILRDEAGRPLLGWEQARRIPWGILLLFGGGFALADAFQVSGLAAALAHALGTMAQLPILLTVLLICLGTTFLTELTSNTATATLLLPILASVAAGTGVSPLLLMVPAAVAASCAFMLPVATPPNAIVFGSGRVTMKEMARVGLVLNLLTALVVSGLAVLLVPRVF